MLLFGMFLIPNAHTNITEIDIDFQVGKCNVDTAYSDNARQLANLEKTIQYVNSHPNVRIERLTISGYASPEGPAVKNKQLGETRANALEQYRVSRNLVGINFRHPNVMPNFAVWKTITYRLWHRWCCQPRF